MEIIAKLKDQGWYLTDDGIKKLPEDVDKSDTRKIIQAAMDVDFREIARGALPTDLSKKDETMSGRIVLQILKIRNIAAPKADEENHYAPRLFQLDLTDGINQVQALEIESISALNFNTPPGTKIFLKSERIPLMQGILMIRSNDIQVLGGKVPNLVEKWEMSRTLLKYAKGGRVMNGGTSGPPPWTAFGKRIQQQNVNVGNDKNFKSLAAATEKEGKENNEFDAMRNEAIAEAAKAGSKKIFGGGNQQIVDHNVKKIMEKGYTEEEAKNTLRATRNNLEKALFNLKRRDEYKNKDDSKISGYDKSKLNTQTNDRNASNNNKRSLNSNTRDNFSNKKGGKDDSVPTKPAGNVSLFDFLTDKLPSNSNETEKSSSNLTQNQQQYGTSSSSSHQQSSRYESKSDRPSRTSDSYNSSNTKPSYYNNNNNNSQQQSSSYSDNRNQNNQQNQQHHIPNSQSSRSSMNQKFENNLSSSFQANRNYSQDNERSKNRSNRESTERSGTSSSNTGSNRNYQNSYQGRSGGNTNDRQYDDQNSDRHYNNRNQRNSNYNQQNPKLQQGNERDGSSRSGGNDRNNYQGSNTSHFQYHQHQNNSGNTYDNNRNSRNDNHSYRNGYENSRSGGGSSGNYSYKGNHSQISSSRYSQKDNASNSYHQNQSQNHGSNNSRTYTDNRQQSYHQQHSNQNTDAKLNKIIEDTSKLKIDSQSQHQQQQQPQQQMQQHQQQQHSQKSRHIQNTSSQRNQNLTYQQQQQQHIAPQHQPQIMTVVSHQGPPPNQPQLSQHTVQSNQQQPHFQPPPPQVHSAQHSLQTSAFTQLPNGFAYDPNKIMGFQNKETNDFAMTLLKSQGIPTALTPTTALAPPQPQHPHPSVTPNASQSTTQHPGAPAYPTMQIGHPPPTMSQHSFATAGPAFVMQPTSMAPPPQLATIGSQVAHTHTPVGAGLPGSLQGPPQPNPGATFSMNSGESWNWKIGDRCLAKYWDDGRFYEAEITGISDKTCVVFYLGYGNHEEVLKLDCLPITDAQNRAINFGATQAAAVVAIQQQQPPPPTAVQLAGASRGGLPNRYRGDRQINKKGVEKKY